MNIHVSRREWLYVALYSIILLALVSGPYWLGWAHQNTDTVFSGFVFGAEDAHTYIAKMRLGVQGHWNFRLLYTPEPHEGLPLILLFYILPGHIIGQFMAADDPALPGVMVGTYHLLRFIFGALLIAVMYRFIAFFLAPVRQRMLALMLATLSGGLGWLLLFVKEIPPEFYIPEGFTLQILLGLPHLALARSALLGGLLVLLHSLNRTRWGGYAVLTGILWLIMGLCVPFYLAVMYAVLGVWGLALWAWQRRFPWEVFWRAVVAGSITLPLFAYNAWAFMVHPFFAGWSAQNILPSPPLWHYLLAYLPLGVLAVAGGRWLWPRVQVTSMPLLIWPPVALLLVYLPVNIQRRLAESVILPLAILATLGLARLAQRVRIGYLMTGVLLLTLPANLILLAGGYVAAVSKQPLVNIPAEQVRAFEWLDTEATPWEIVLSTHQTGNLIPAYTNLGVFVGHGPETLNADGKQEMVEALLADELSAAEREALYREYDIRYIFFGPAEQAFSSPERRWQEGLIPIYSAGDYTILAVPSDKR